MSSIYQVQAQDYYLSGSGISPLVVSIPVLNLILPNSGTPLTMAMFGSIGFGTLEPETDREENFSFTGITNNGNGTWTLTGVTRGLDFTFPGAQDLTLRKSHAGGTKLRFSNSFQFYETLYANKTRAQTIIGPWVFNANTDGANPKIDSNSYTFTALDYITKGFSDATYLLLDGSNSPMQGPIDMGGFNITNMADGVNNTDAITLEQLQSAIISGALPATTTQQGIVLIATQADWDNIVDTETIGLNTYYNLPPISYIRAAATTSDQGMAAIATQTDWDNTVDTQVLDGNTYYNIAPISIIKAAISSPINLSLFDDFVGGGNEKIQSTASVPSISLSVLGDLGWALSLSGAPASTIFESLYIDGVSGRPGIIEIQTDNATNQRGAMVLGASNQLIDVGSGGADAYAVALANNVTYTSMGPMNQGNWSIRSSFKLLSTANNRVKMGLVISTEEATQTPTDGIYFEFDTAVDTNWRGTTTASSASSQTVTTVAADTSFHKFEIIMNAAGNSVEFKIDGVSLGSLATNIPSATGIPFFCIETLSNNAKRIQIDYWKMDMILASR